MSRDSRGAIDIRLGLRHVILHVPRKSAAPALAISFEEIRPDTGLGRDLDAGTGDVGEINSEDLAAADDDHVALAVRVADGQALAEGLVPLREREQGDDEEAGAGLHHAHLEARAELDVPEKQPPFRRDGVDDMLFGRREGGEAAAAGWNIENGIAQRSHLRAREGRSKRR